MQIKINIEKKHLYFLTAVIFILSAGIFALAAANTTAKIFHEELAVDKITGYKSATTTIENDLKVTGKIEVTGTNNMVLAGTWCGLAGSLDTCNDIPCGTGTPRDDKCPTGWSMKWVGFYGSGCSGAWHDQSWVTCVKD